MFVMDWIKYFFSRELGFWGTNFQSSQSKFLELRVPFLVKSRQRPFCQKPPVFFLTVHYPRILINLISSWQDICNSSINGFFQLCYWCIKEFAQVHHVSNVSIFITQFPLFDLQTVLFSVDSGKKYWKIVSPI